MSLRLRILLSVVVLVLVGLLVADAVTYVSLRSFLLGRVDQQLLEARNPAFRALSDSSSPPPQQFNVPHGGVPNFPPGTYAAWLNASGKTLQAVPFTYGGTSTSKPKLTVALVEAAAAGWWPVVRDGRLGRRRWVGLPRSGLAAAQRQRWRADRGDRCRGHPPHRCERHASAAAPGRGTRHRRCAARPRRAGVVAGAPRDAAAGRHGGNRRAPSPPAT